jgi:hypothetical protein
MLPVVFSPFSFYCLPACLGGLVEAGIIQADLTRSGLARQAARYANRELGEHCRRKITDQALGA